MPHFNEFRINEVLLGEVLLNKRKSLDSLHIEEDEEAINFLVSLEEEKRQKSKSIFVMFLEKITQKNLVSFTDSNGDKTIREYMPTFKREKPIVKLAKTIERPLDFGDDVNEWRNYIHEENIRDEERQIEKEKMQKLRQGLVDLYSNFIVQKMLKIS